MKKIILTALLMGVFCLPCNADTLYKNDKSAEVQRVTVKDLQEVTQDGARIGIPVFCYFYKNHQYQSKGIHFAITDGIIRLTKHVPILKNHPNICAVAVGAGYFLIWDVCIEKQADWGAVLSDSSAVLVNIDYVGLFKRKKIK
jgi:hypothetical protein